MTAKLAPWRIGTSLLLGLAAACGDAGNDVPENRTVERSPLPDNYFKPAAIEDTIDAFVARIEQTEPLAANLSIVLDSNAGEGTAIETGIRRALQELQVEASVSLTGDDAVAQERAIRDCLDEGCAAVGLAPAPGDLEEAVDDAYADGVPVITVGRDLGDSNREFWLGTDATRAGELIGETLLTAMTTREVTVVILGGDSADASRDRYERAMAAKLVLEERNARVVVVPGTPTDEGREADIEAMTQAMADAIPGCEGMIDLIGKPDRLLEAAARAEIATAHLAQNPIIAPGIARHKDGEPVDIVVGQTIAEEVTYVTVGWNTEIADYLREGTIAATAVERPFHLGYLLAYVLYGVGSLGTEEARYVLTPNRVGAHRISIGMDAVYAEQVEEYQRFADAVEAASTGSQ